MCPLRKAKSKKHRAKSTERRAGTTPEPLDLSPEQNEAQMAKLVDALVSGTSVSNDVQVRVLFWAQERCKGVKAQGRKGSIRGTPVKFGSFT